jgi:transposase
VSDPTSSVASVVADTIVRTVELGVTITDAAVLGESTVVFCNLLDDGQRSCPGCGIETTCSAKRPRDRRTSDHRRGRS